MTSENQHITIEIAKKNLEYAINLYNCIETPLDEKIVSFAAQDKTATAYRNLALRSLKGGDVDGRIFTAKNSALDRFYHWQRWIREYEEGIAIGEERGREEKRKMAQKMLRKCVDLADISEFTGLSIEEIESLRVKQ
jgi:predicted transposase/invertase (TIGR01784 family)